MLLGAGDEKPPEPRECKELAAALLRPRPGSAHFSGDPPLVARLVARLGALPFESRKHAAAIFSGLMRQVGTASKCRDCGRRAVKVQRGGGGVRGAGGLSGFSLPSRKRFCANSSATFFTSRALYRQDDAFGGAAVAAGGGAAPTGPPSGGLVALLLAGMVAGEGPEVQDESPAVDADGEAASGGDGGGAGPTDVVAT